jgi:ABC-type enterobactin transport system permease subunit
MKPWNLKQLAITVSIAAALWAILAVACLMVGSGTQGIWPSDPDIRWGRLEIVLLASLVGAALGSSGVAYQSILQNPLADPYLLGDSRESPAGGVSRHSPSRALLPPCVSCLRLRARAGDWSHSHCCWSA